MMFNRFGLTAAMVRAAASLLLVAAAGSFVGCSGASPTVPDQQNETAKTVKSKGKNNKQPADDGESGNGQTQDERAGGTRINANGKKWIGDIPYDVWFDSPLEIVNTEGEVGTEMTADAGDSASRDPSAETSDSTGGTESAGETGNAGPADWAKLLPEAVIEAEIKTIRNEMNNGLQSLSQYQAHYKEIQVDGAVLSAIAMIMPHHPATFTWKPNAKYIRGLGGEISKNSTALGKKAYDATKEPFEKIVSVLSGNLPPDLEEVPETVSFAEGVARGDLMKRMQMSYDWLRKNVPAETVLMEQGERIRHEAALLATMGTIINHESYDLTDEASYRQYATSLIESCQTVIDASNNGRFDEYSGALDKIYKACNDCHVDWRGE